MSDPSTTLHYTAAAKQWVEALPVGNGRIGAMVHGRICREVLQLNEDSLWEGGPTDRINPKAAEGLQRVRDLGFSGDSSAAVKVADECLTSVPRSIDPYQTFADCYVDLVDWASKPTREVNTFNQELGPKRSSKARPEGVAPRYHRELDLRDGIARTSFNYLWQDHEREVFASAPDQVICARFAVAEGTLSATVSLHRAQDVIHCRARDGVIQFEGRLHRGGLSFAALCQVRVEGGEVIDDGHVLQVRDARAFELRIALATGRRSPTDISADPVARCRDALAAASAHDYAKLKQRHIADHHALFDRCALSLPTSESSTLPTNQRLQALRDGKDDPALCALLFHYGRYLLMGSSRPGSLPANLQGIWNHHLAPPWCSDYHTNINLQMNYWPADVTNLSECHRPLFDWMAEMQPFGERCAREMYGCSGWVMHHVSNPWGNVEPMDGGPGLWPMGAVWLCAHLWQHFRFTGDRDFLREQAWPLMRGAAEFVSDFLVEAPANSACPGKLVTNPSHSPENGYISGEHKRCMFTYAATMDIQLIRELLGNCRAVIAELGLNEDAFLERSSEILERLPEVRVSERTGGVMEWIEDYEEGDPGHCRYCCEAGRHFGDFACFLAFSIRNMNIVLARRPFDIDLDPFFLALQHKKRLGSDLFVVSLGTRTGRRLLE